MMAIIKNNNDNNIHINNNTRFKRVSLSRRKAGHQRSVLSALHHHRLSFHCGVFHIAHILSGSPSLLRPKLT